MANQLTTETERGVITQTTHRTGFLFLQVTNLWQKEFKKALAVLDLTPTQFLLLERTLWISGHQQEVTQIALSEHSRTDPMTTSQVLRTLQTKGLIQRKEHPADTRAKLIELTEVGKAVCKKAIRRVSTFDEQFFSQLGNQAEELNKNLLSLLGRPE
jgi:MarR family transcriptional regulator, organic hydroperoxide resistance regulator